MYRLVIVSLLNMQQPPSAPATHEAGSLGSEDTEGDKKWIRIMLDRMTEISGEIMTCEGCGVGW